MTEKIYFNEKESASLARIKENSGLGLKSLIKKHIFSQGVPRSYEKSLVSKGNNVTEPRLIKFTLYGKDVEKLIYLQTTTGLKPTDIFRLLLAKSKRIKKEPEDLQLDNLKQLIASRSHIKTLNDANNLLDQIETLLL
jgi:hypothetical protein